MELSTPGVRSDLHVDGFLAVKCTPAHGKALPFAGQCRNGGLGRFKRTAGASSPSDEGSTTDSQGCTGSRTRGGEPSPQLTAAAAGKVGGPSLEATRPVQTSAIVQRPPSQAVVGSGRRPQAASRSGGGFRDRAQTACLQRCPNGSERSVAVRGLAEVFSERGGSRVSGNRAGDGQGRFEVSCSPRRLEVNTKIGGSRARPRVAK